ncbi:MAG: FAD-binding protein [Deltaproteobacteria bacterium]|nr:FAD-binding protein [Deltaproteobacteria bacterium]
MRAKPKIIIVGAGITGMMAAVCLADKGADVSLVVSCDLQAAGVPPDDHGINAALNIKNGDSPEMHFRDTIIYGEGLAGHSLVDHMCRVAPHIIHYLERVGVVFLKTPENALEINAPYRGTVARQFDGEVPVGLQALKCLKQQIRKKELLETVRIYNRWEFLSLILDHAGLCSGITIQNARTMEIAALKADAVIMADGDMTGLYGSYSLRGPDNHGYAMAQLYRQGAYLANCEFVGFYPYAFKTADKSIAVPSKILEAGCEVWASCEGEPCFFLDEAGAGLRAAKGSNQDVCGIPSDVRVVRLMGEMLRKYSGTQYQTPEFFLKIQQPQPHDVYRRWADLVRQHRGADAVSEPLQIAPAVQTTLGGLWTGPDHMTNIPGLFAAGDCEYHYHGAAVLPGNGLLRELAAGVIVSDHVHGFISGAERTGAAAGDEIFSRAVKQQQERLSDACELNGPEGVYGLYEEFYETMMSGLGFVRDNDGIAHTLKKIDEFKERLQRVSLNDRTMFFNQEIFFFRHFEGMLDLAFVVAKSALCRNETRGFHYKTEFAERDDENYLKTTKVKKGSDGPVLTYEDIESALSPEPLALSRGWVAQG